MEPSEAVNWKKQQKLRRLAEAYIKFRRPFFEYCRFDVVSVIYDGKARIEHIKDAFA
jgi:putative endonuclease